jgi:hypothetical protein
MQMKPTRKAEMQDDGTWKITVTPPAWSGFNASTVVLTQDQYNRYLEWQSGASVIQACLRDLSADVREILLSGISPTDWNAAFADDDKD